MSLSYKRFEMIFFLSPDQVRRYDVILQKIWKDFLEVWRYLTTATKYLKWFWISTFDHVFLILSGNQFNFEMQNIINKNFFSILFRQQNLSPFNVQVKYYD